MAKDHEPKSKSGFTVGELEGKMKKYGLEIALCVTFILTAIFAMVWGGAMILWSILLCMIFAIIGVLVPRSMHKILSHTLKFVYKEKITSIIIAVIGIVVGIFLPPIIFAIIGLIAGKSFAMDALVHGADIEHDVHDHHHDHEHHE